MPVSFIRFQSEKGVDLPVVDAERAIAKWIKTIAAAEGKICGQLLYFFCTDKYLLNINRRFLKHNTYTDIITFDYSERNKIAGEIYISTERVKENAETYQQPFARELMRTVIHGVLHLCGYTDKTTSAKQKMRQKEDDALQLLPRKFR